MLNSIKYGPLYSQNYYRIVKEKNRTYYEVYSLQRTEEVRKITPRFPSSACGLMEPMKLLQRSAAYAVFRAAKKEDRGYG